MIAPGLERFAVSVDELHHPPDNPRKGNVDAITKSLERFGQVRPVIALPDGTVVAGNHVLRAIEQLGWEQIAAVKVELSEEDAQAYLLADNRLSELGSYADEALAEILERVAADHNLDGTGYEEDEITKLLKRLRPQAPDDFPDIDDGLATKYTCPECQYQWG
jgi:ParB-like chromosome segregation protein Spo0J